MGDFTYLRKIVQSPYYWQDEVNTYKYGWGNNEESKQARLLGFYKYLTSTGWRAESTTHVVTYNMKEISLLKYLFGKDKPKFTRTPMGEETKRKLSLITKKWRAAHPTFAPGRGKRSEEFRHACSQRITQEHLNSASYLMRGYVGSVGYQSELERGYLLRLQNDPQVIKVSRIGSSVTYKFDGREKRYIPDFKVTNADGTIEIVEVKPRFHWNNAMNIAKWEAARKMFGESFVIVDPRVLRCLKCKTMCTPDHTCKDEQVVCHCKTCEINRRDLEGIPTMYNPDVFRSPYTM